MHILFLNPFFHPYQGGTEKHIVEVGKRLAKKHAITVLTGKIDGTVEEEEFQGMHVVREPLTVYHNTPPPFPPPVPILTEHARYLKTHIADYEIVHSHNRFVYGLSDAALVKKHGKKLALTLHNARPRNIDYVTDTFGGMYDDVIAKRFMNKCDGIAAVSKDTLASTMPAGYPGVTRVVYNGVDHETYAPGKNTEWKEKLGVEKQMILTNARLLPQKGIAYLIDAMKGLDTTLIVFGRGPLKEELAKRARQKGVDLRFITERITDEELASLYNNADCFVLPSLYEPLGIAILEAMACGLPVVTTRAGGNAELVDTGKGGFVVPTRNAFALKEAIERIFADDKKARAFGAHNRKQVLEKYTWEHVTRNVERFYESL